MTQNDRHKWNTRYHQKKHTPAVRPIVQDFHDLASKGTALDLAAGLGSNALFLAQQGFKVLAVDISDVALLPLADLHVNLQPICLDLDTWDIPTNHFDLILNIRFLSRRFFPQIIEGLKPDGVLIAETYLIDDEKGNPSYASDAPPPSRDYYLRPNELLHAFLPLHIVHYHEEVHTRDGEKGRSAGLVGRKY